MDSCCLTENQFIVKKKVFNFYSFFFIFCIVRLTKSLNKITVTCTYSIIKLLVSLGACREMLYRISVSD